MHHNLLMLLINVSLIYILLLKEMKIAGLFLSILIVFSLNGLFALWARIFSVPLSEMIYFGLSGLTLTLILFYKFITHKKRKINTDIMPFDLMPILGLILSLIIFYIHNEFGKQIAYLSVDSAAHFDMASTYARTNLMMSDMQSKIMAYPNYPILFYINAGIILRDFNLSSIIYKIQIFSWINWLLYFSAIIGLASLIKATGSKNIVLNYIVFLLISTGFLLDIFISGFLPQLLGVLFFIGFLLAVYLEKNKAIQSKFLWITIQNIMIIGVFLSYFYYIPEILLSLFIINYTSTPFSTTKIVFKKYWLSLLLILPIISNYLIASKVINADGGITKDLYSSFILLLPALFILKKSHLKSNNLVLKAFLVAAISFSFFLYILCLLKLVSPYYFFKNYVILQILFGLSFVAYFKDNLKRKIYFLLRNNKIRVFFIILIAMLPLKSHLLSAKNSLIYLENLKNITNVKLSDGQINLLSKLEGYGNSSSCLSTSDALMAIWYGEITDGLYFRGIANDNHVWNHKAWNDLYIDSNCDKNQYRFVIDLSCKHNKKIFYSNTFGCIYSQ